MPAFECASRQRCADARAADARVRADARRDAHLRAAFFRVRMPRRHKKERIMRAYSARSIRAPSHAVCAARSRVKIYAIARMRRLMRRALRFFFFRHVAAIFLDTMFRGFRSRCHQMLLPVAAIRCAFTPCYHDAIATIPDIYAMLIFLPCYPPPSAVVDCSPRAATRRRENTSRARVRRRRATYSARRARVRDMRAVTCAAYVAAVRRQSFAQCACAPRERSAMLCVPRDMEVKDASQRSPQFARAYSARELREAGKSAPPRSRLSARVSPCTRGRREVRHCQRVQRSGVAQRGAQVCVRKAVRSLWR